MTGIISRVRRAAAALAYLSFLFSSNGLGCRASKLLADQSLTTAGGEEKDEEKVLLRCVDNSGQRVAVAVSLFYFIFPVLFSELLLNFTCCFLLLLLVFTVVVVVAFLCSPAAAATAKETIICNLPNSIRSAWMDGWMDGIGRDCTVVE